MAQPQQTRIVNFFKLVPKDSPESSPLQEKPQPQPNDNCTDDERHRPAGGEEKKSKAEPAGAAANDRKSSEKRPPAAGDLVEGDNESVTKRPRLSAASATDTPPRPQPRASPASSPFAGFLSSPSSAAAGKENQSQFLDSQPAAVQSLLVGFGPSWLQALKPELAKAYFVKLAEFVRSERSGKVVYPPPGDVFSWTRACRLQEVKVVILGQDPYHGPNQAHGLCFSVLRPTVPPPSLLNIFKEAAQNFPGKFQPPGHGDLTGWAEQGVLLLNAVLTVRRGEPNSHQGRGWEAFTDAVVSVLNARCSGLVFILWGNYAQKKGAKIDKRRHKVICGAHPSPLAVNRGGFFGKKFFKEANEYLKSVSKTPIDWCYLP